MVAILSRDRWVNTPIVQLMILLHCWHSSPQSLSPQQAKYCYTACDINIWLVVNVQTQRLLALKALPLCTQQVNCCYHDHTDILVVRCTGCLLFFMTGIPDAFTLCLPFFLKKKHWPLVTDVMLATEWSVSSDTIWRLSDSSDSSCLDWRTPVEMWLCRQPGEQRPRGLCEYRMTHKTRYSVTFICLLLVINIYPSPAQFYAPKSIDHLPALHKLFFFQTLYKTLFLSDSSSSSKVSSKQSKHKLCYGNLLTCKTGLYIGTPPVYGANGKTDTWTSITKLLFMGTIPNDCHALNLILLKPGWWGGGWWVVGVGWG